MLALLLPCFSTLSGIQVFHFMLFAAYLFSIFAGLVLHAASWSGCCLTADNLRFECKNFVPLDAPKVKIFTTDDQSLKSLPT